MWNARNSGIFWGAVKIPTVLCKDAECYIQDYAAAQVQFGSPSKEVPRREIRWKPPEGGWVKENMDGAVFHDIQKVGIGVVIRNDLGEFLGACCELLNVSGFRITGSFACY